MDIEIINMSKIHIEPTDLNTVAIKVGAAGILDTAEGSGAILTLMIAVIRGGLLRVIIDLDSLQTIDSRGIGTLINAAKMIREKRGDLVLIRVPGHIDAIFQPVSLHRFIKFFATEQEAVNYLKYLQ